MESAVVIREATEADDPILAELERRSPLVMDGGAVIIDRGNDYFAASRLMEDVTVLIAEVDGVPAGVYCGARHRVRIAGVDRYVLYIHHARIPPENQRHGLGRALGARLQAKYRERVDTSYWYIAPGNTISQGYARGASNKWSFGPLWATLDTFAVAGPHAGRAATLDDAAHIAELLNAYHEGEEMFLPYTALSLAERLSRAPDEYAWDNLWLTDDAVVGVWPEGRSIVNRFIDSDGVVTESRGAAVLDYGCIPGAEEQLESLVRAWCGGLRRSGLSELTVFTSPGARGERLISQLATEVRPFDFWTPSIPEPEGANTRGLYVDHVYF